jgi:hypothetical protein
MRLVRVQFDAFKGQLEPAGPQSMPDSEGGGTYLVADLSLSSSTSDEPELEMP